MTDTDKATNSSLANITVLKSNDYPPEANAGIVLYFIPMATTLLLCEVSLSMYKRSWKKLLDIIFECSFLSAVKIDFFIAWKLS